MTKEEKEEIISLRNQSVTYAEISKELNIPVSTIKTFCRRAGMVTPVKKNIPVCKNCGKAISKISATKPRLFCCDKCKMDWWNQHRNERVSSKIITKNCAACGKPFKSYIGANRKYCCSACYRERSNKDA